MTPYQLNLYIQSNNEINQEKQKLMEAESEERLQIAYLTALWTSRWVWQKRVSSYEELMSKSKNKSKEIMTPNEMLEEVKKLNASFGGTTY